jgi:hypothetical protein
VFECGCDDIPVGDCDCEGNILDECGVCDGNGIPDGDCDCFGNNEDCSGECGGTAEIDECGECGGNGQEQCWDGSYECDLNDCPVFSYSVYRDGQLLASELAQTDYLDGNLGYLENHCYTVTYTINGIESDNSGGACATTNGAHPDLFQFNQSTLQALYFFDSVTIDGIPIDTTDWVGAFNDDVCVGAKQWNTSACNNGVCEIVVMGNDGYTETENYMQMGEFPSFKLFDALTGEYYDAVPIVNYAWQNQGLYLIDFLSVQP